MKKLLKIFVLVVAVVLLLLIIIPVAFQGKIVERIRQTVNEQVDATVDFGRVRLSVLRHFPDVSLRVDDLVITSHAPFEGDTLAFAGRIVVTVDLRSVLGEQAIEIKRISIDSPDLRLRMSDDGIANWDIVPPSEAAIDDPPPADDESPGFVLTLRRVDITEGSVLYHDDLYVTYVDAEGLNASLRGDLSMDVTTVSTRDAFIDAFSLRYSRFPVLSRVGVKLSADMEMDMRDWQFTFRENSFLINDLPLSFDGVIGLPEGGGTQMDFSFAATRSDFASFLSLIPAIYAGDIAQLETDGFMALRGSVGGLLKGEMIPSFDVSLQVEDGMFRYRGLPGSVNDVQIEAHLVNRGNNMDETEVSMPLFGMRLAGNPVEGHFALRTPVSDPWLDLGFAAGMNLGDVATVVPLDDDMALGGQVDGRLEARGHVSALTEGAYHDFHAGGEIMASDIFVRAPMLTQPLHVSTASAAFSPQHLSMPVLQATIGDSDIDASGRIDNIIQYLVNGDVLSGQFRVHSNNLDINQLMPATPEPEEEEAPVTLSVIPVPANLDFTLESSVQRVVFGEMNINQLEGVLRIADEQVEMDQLGMDLFGGRLALNGSYNTRGELPDVSFALDFFSFDLTETFRTLRTVRMLAPVAEYASGRLSGGLSLSAQLDSSLMPVLESLSGGGSLRSSAIGVENIPAMVQLAERLQMDMFKEMDIRDVALRFSFRDGKVETEPFGFRFGQTEATAGGVTWFDRRIDYGIRFDIPFEQFGTRAQQVLDDLVMRAADRGIDAHPGERVMVDVHIGGTMTSPELSVGMPGAVDAVRERIRDEALRLVLDREERIRDEADRVRDDVEEKVTERIEEVSERAQEELALRAQQLIDGAERRAASVRREAANAAEKIRQGAREQAARLVDEASGPLAKAAARVTGDALVGEADRRAQQLEEEADSRAETIMEEAREEADRILQQGE